MGRRVDFVVLDEKAPPAQAGGGGPPCPKPFHSQGAVAPQLRFFVSGATSLCAPTTVRASGAAPLCAPAAGFASKGAPGPHASRLVTLVAAAAVGPVLVRTLRCVYLPGCEDFFTIRIESNRPDRRAH